MKRITSLLIALLLIFSFVIPMTNAEAAAFKDVNAAHWATSYVNNLIYNGVTNGYTDRTYKPNNNVTRAEWAKMLVYATKQDADKQSWYNKIIAHDNQTHFGDVFVELDEQDYWYESAMLTFCWPSGEFFNDYSGAMTSFDYDMKYYLERNESLGHGGYFVSVEEYNELVEYANSMTSEEKSEYFENITIEHFENAPKMEDYYIDGVFDEDSFDYEYSIYKSTLQPKFDELNYYFSIEKYAVAYYYFYPNKNLTREIAVKMLVDINNYDLNSANLSLLDMFSDKDTIPTEYRAHIALAIEHGLVNGYTDGTFRPKGEITRAEIAAVICRAFYGQDLNNSMDTSVTHRSRIINSTSDYAGKDFNTLTDNDYTEFANYKLNPESGNPVGVGGKNSISFSYEYYNQTLIEYTRSSSGEYGSSSIKITGFDENTIVTAVMITDNKIVYVATNNGLYIYDYLYYHATNKPLTKLFSHEEADAYGFSDNSYWRLKDSKFIKTDFNGNTLKSFTFSNIEMNELIAFKRHTVQFIVSTTDDIILYDSLNKKFVMISPI